MPKIMVFRGREEKLVTIARLFSHYLIGNILDVGCDAKHLSRFVEERYVGVDISASPDVRASLGDSLPFQDKSFDTVVAFDVLEHLDRFHFAFDELCRVSRLYLIIALPNMYEWRFRAIFLLGNRLSGKYGLPYESPTDRHRWLFNFEEARNFVRQRGVRNGFIVNEEVIGYYRYRRLLPQLMTVIGKALTPKGASLFACRYCAVLKRSDV
jgi:hypothetical protein